MDHHHDEWVESCLDFGLTIKGKGGLAEKSAHEAEQLGGYLTNLTVVLSEDCPCFSCKAFTDGLIEWIVTNDQVCAASHAGRC